MINDIPNKMAPIGKMMQSCIEGGIEGLYVVPLGRQGKEEQMEGILASQHFQMGFKFIRTTEG